jgi:hypothetical protein
MRTTGKCSAVRSYRQEELQGLAAEGYSRLCHIARSSLCTTLERRNDAGMTVVHQLHRRVYLHLAAAEVNPPLNIYLCNTLEPLIISTQLQTFMDAWRMHTNTNIDTSAPCANICYTHAYCII